MLCGAIYQNYDIDNNYDDNKGNYDDGYRM